VIALAAAAVLPLLSAAPPAPPPAADVVDVAHAIPDALLDLRYATERNFVGRALYPAGARCLLLRPVAERLAAAAARLREEGLRLRLYDCYRPLSVQRALWRILPTPGLVADPAKGSHHNRAAAVDVGLVDARGAAVPLPTDFDVFGPRARAAAVAGVGEAERRNRDLLRAAMEAEGFRVNRMEWWHFDAPEARGAPVLDLPLTP
jgi:zinc D-Ala-D-Ala dipeptidase